MALKNASRLLLAVLFVAAGAAGFAMTFRSALQVLYRRILGGHDVLAAFLHLPWYLRFALPALGGLLAGTMRRGQSFGDVMESVVLGRVKLSVRGTLLKALGSWFAIAFGGSIGREGPLIQFGGAFGYKMSDFFEFSDEQRRILTAAGVAAGFTAAYNTPIAAILFVVEVVAGVIALDAIVYVMIATAISTTILRAAVGGGPIYGQRAFTIGSPLELLAHASLGVAGGLVAYGFTRLLAVGEKAFDRKWLKQPLRAAFGGLLVGAMAIGFPEVAGNGSEPLNRLLDGQYAVSLVATLLFAKAIATTSSVSSGSPGGVFTPSLFLGGALGALWGVGCATVFHIPGAPGSYALVGMAAVSAATTHAPMMAAVLVFELSGDYAIALPLILATAGATAVSRALYPDSVYGSELRRRGVRWTMTLEGRQIERAPPKPE